MKTKFIILLSIILSSAGCVKSTNLSTDYNLAVNTDHPINNKVKLVPVAVPGQLMKVQKNSNQKLIGEKAIIEANKKAIKQPDSKKYINSIMNFDYMEGALYQIYCAPLRVTDIQFGKNEHIISVGAGDTLRWQVSKTFSGAGANRQEHLLIKPIESEISNSIVVTTNQRTYHLILHATKKTYMASVTWRYPNSDSLITNLNTLNTSNFDFTENNNPLNLNNLNFNYQIKVTNGNIPKWLPKMIFNNGKKTYIQFPIDMQEAPILFIGNNEKNSQLINYRVSGNYYIVDSVISQAQLRSGQNKQNIVQITHKN